MGFSRQENGTPLDWSGVHCLLLDSTSEHDIYLVRNLQWLSIMLRTKAHTQKTIKRVSGLGAYLKPSPSCSILGFLQVFKHTLLPAPKGSHALLLPPPNSLCLSYMSYRSQLKYDFLLDSGLHRLPTQITILFTIFIVFSIRTQST